LSLLGTDGPAGRKGENKSALGCRSGGNTKKSRDKRLKGEESVREKRE